MSRPIRCRRIEQLPTYRSFSPDDVEPVESIIMSLDEFETLRLLDNEGLTQESCASKMNISRTTVTAIYDRARRKVAQALVNGKRLMIMGGIGRTEHFKLFDVADKKVVGEQVLATNGTGHGALAGLLQAAKVDVLICGGIGMGARMALTDTGIQLYAGIQGSADEAVKALVDGTLNTDPNSCCDHQGHHDGQCEHSHCADHHCHGN